MGEIKIEKAGVSDVLLLRDTALKAYGDHYLHLWYDEGKWYLEKYFSVERLTTELSDLNARFFIAYYIGEPVGFLKLNLNASVESTEDKSALELERIYLTSKATGRGIGKELVELTLQIAREYNKNVVWLKAMDTSAKAISFYRNMGFEIAGTYKLEHAMMKEELRGMVIMKRTVERA